MFVEMFVTFSQSGETHRTIHQAFKVNVEHCSLNCSLPTIEYVQLLDFLILYKAEKKWSRKICCVVYSAKTNLRAVLHLEETKFLTLNETWALQHSLIILKFQQFLALISL